MNVRDLLEQLQDADPDAEVLLATQPSYPMQYTIDTVVETVLEDEDGEQTVRAVYLTEGGEPEDGPYLNSAAADEIGW